MQTVIGKKQLATLAISEIISDAISFNPKNWTMNSEKKLSMMPPALQTFLILMSDLKVNFVLVGGVAIQAYIETRNTQDVDFIVKKADAMRLFNYLKVLDSDDNFANCITSEGLRVDFLFAENPIFNYVMQGFTQKIEYTEGSLQTATPEGLLLMKLYAWSNLQIQNSAFPEKNTKAKIILYESDIKLLTVFFEPDFEKILRLLKRQISAVAYRMTSDFVATL